jgi:hypothetical protein
MLVPAELTLHRVPAFIVPSQWRGYVVGQCPERGLQRISVTFDPDGEFKSAVGTKRTCMPPMSVSAFEVIVLKKSGASHSRRRQ